jgi:glycerol-3-phosphate acyltransferase PlsY
MVAAGVGGVLGNVLNPYRSLSGGQGLGISVGVLLAAWPISVPIALAVAAIAAAVTRTAPPAALAALATLIAASAIWTQQDLGTVWGVPAYAVPVLAVGLTLVVAPKQVRNLRAPRRQDHATNEP